MSKELLNKFQNEYEGQLKAYNDAFKSNDFAAALEAEEKLKTAEKDYAHQKQLDVFAALKDTEDPILNACKTYGYEVLAHKAERVEGKIVGFVSSKKLVQIDLLKLCAYCDLETSWKHDAQRLNLRLTLRAAKELGMTDEEVKEIHDSYYMDKLVERSKLGATPTSKNQICKALQELVDLILFEEKNGKNAYAVNNHDVAFLLMCYSKKSRGALKVATAKHQMLINLVAEILHRVVTGGKYSLDYKRFKEGAVKVYELAQDEQAEDVETADK